MSNKRILIVEDESITILHIKKVLEGFGYEVAGIASSGDDAILQALELRPDLVLMDIVLRGRVDGVEAAEKIQTILNIPVIYLTAHTDEGTLKRAKETEPFGYVVKPLREHDLYIAIEFALYRSKAELERKHLMFRLQDVLADVRTLSGLLPVCPSCREVRDDKGYLEQAEFFMRDHTEETFHYGLCVRCAGKTGPGG